MPVSLEQYAKWLDGRGDLLWPAAPEIQPRKARPHLKRLPGVRVVTFAAYGTLLSISGGELYFVHPQPFIMEAALEKTIHEFKMWQSMSRKPGKPSEYMARIYRDILDDMCMTCSSGSERHPEIRSDELWDRIVKRLIKNEYKYDEAFYGSVHELCEKIAYFFHSSLQGIGPEPGAMPALRTLKERGILLGLVTDAQCFTPVHLLRALRQQGKLATLSELFEPELEAMSFQVGARKPSERLFRAVVAALAQRDIAPNQALHVGSSLPGDVMPARRLGFHTALFAGDKSSLVASNEQLNEKASRPDVMITELGQLAEVVG
jgi:FMN phosphatase YigB (HAD superfamily)